MDLLKFLKVFRIVESVPLALRLRYALLFFCVFWGFSCRDTIWKWDGRARLGGKGLENRISLCRHNNELLLHGSR